MRKNVLILVMVVLISGIWLLGGCESDTQTGALLGTGIGAGVGALAGGDTESTLIGGAIGGAAGYMLGNEGDKKSATTDRETIRQEMNVITKNVTCNNGSIIQVRLARDGVGYRGPRGEYYSTLPTEDQLRPVYGF